MGFWRKLMVSLLCTSFPALVIIIVALICGIVVAPMDFIVTLAGSYLMTFVLLFTYLTITKEDYLQ